MAKEEILSRISDGSYEGFPVEAAADSSKQTFPNAPAVGTIKNGYKYVGGDPAKESSWKKQ